MKIRVKWENYKSRRGVSILGWLREEKVKTYSDIVNRCHPLGVEPPSEEEFRVALDLRSKEKSSQQQKRPPLIVNGKVVKTATTPKPKSKPAPKKKAQPKPKAKKPAVKKAQDK